MLVGKADLSNIKSLRKIRNKECTGIRYIYYLLVFLFVLDLLGIIKSVFTFRAEAVSVTVQAYSNWSFILTIIICIFYTVNYKGYSYRHQVYPQNSKNRFIAYSLFCYLTFIKTQAAALGLYLLQMGTCEILDKIKGNIDFAYSFNLFFLASGSFVMLLYGFLIISAIILLGALDRKFSWWFRISFTGILIILSISGLLINKLKFITREYSLSLFIGKVLVIWLLLVILGFVINKLTRHYKLQKQFMYYHAIGIAAVLVILFIRIYTIASPGVIEMSSGETYDITNNLLNGADYEIDVSDIPEGAQLKARLSEENSENTYLACLNEQTKNSDKILVNCTLPTNIVNDVDLNTYTGMKLVTAIKDNILTIQITSEKNRKVIMLYPFSFLQNFDCFKDRRYFKDKMGFLKGSGMGTIYLFPPAAKKLIIATR